MIKVIWCYTYKQRLRVIRDSRVRAGVRGVVVARWVGRMLFAWGRYSHNDPLQLRLVGHLRQQHLRHRVALRSRLCAHDVRGNRVRVGARRRAVVVAGGRVEARLLRGRLIAIAETRRGCRLLGRQFGGGPAAGGGSSVGGRRRGGGGGRQTALDALVRFLREVDR